MPVIVSQRLMRSMISRFEFFSIMPEFGLLRTMAQNYAKTQANCRSCAKRRSEQQLFGTFMGIVASLPPERLRIFKQFAGIESLQIQGFNRQTGKFEVMIK